MSKNVFDQYQKYFESLINRHKTTCRLENQHIMWLHQTSQQPAHAQQPIDVQHPTQQESLWPMQPDAYMYNRPPQQVPMYQPVQQSFNHQPSGFYCNMAGFQQPMQQYTTHTCQWCFPHQYYIQPSLQNFSQVIMSPQVNSPFEAVGTVEANMYPIQQPPQQQLRQPQQQSFCYPFGMDSMSCGPCTGCKKTPADTQQLQQQQQRLQPQQLHQQQLQPQQRQQQQHQLLQPQQVQKQKNCAAGQDCSSSWMPSIGGNDESTGDKKERLPLGVEQPFVVGPTTYQYFFG